ncbi:hypothetical protein TNCT_367171 [Trichonephila clavata]|uniref:Uncharacterized protein n=1 Tax=Trichonephila clavata TaxID=2740835 RepID=A0A8X6K2Y4_TRICU|nr:hypothetical protein TNCT_367171 [Trichonephila clavata]
MRYFYGLLSWKKKEQSSTRTALKIPRSKSRLLKQISIIGDEDKLTKNGTVERTRLKRYISHQGLDPYSSQ